jgi:hypothetical protein
MAWRRPPIDPKRIYIKGYMYILFERNIPREKRTQIANQFGKTKDVREGRSYVIELRKKISVRLATYRLKNMEEVFNAGRIKQF